MKQLMYIVILVLLCSLSVSAQVSVGWEASCDYDVSVQADALQQAIDDGASEIRLSNQFGHNVSLDINDSVVLKGGYSNCADAGNDIQTNINTVLDGAGQGFPVLKIHDIVDAQVWLDSLTLQNGTGVIDGNPQHRAGGLTLTSLTGEVFMNRMNIKDNQGAYGGGISVYSSVSDGSLNVIAMDLAVQDNTASQNGGGINCRNSWWPQFNLSLDISTSTVRNNHSESHGGGLVIDGCDVDFISGIYAPFVNSNLDKEIFNNTADKSGGGLVVFSGLINLIGQVTDPFNVFLNKGNQDVSALASGGAVFASGEGAVVNLINSYVSSNETGRYGGGLAVSFDAEINMMRDSQGCQYSAFCSQLKNNSNLGLSTGGGGALSARYGGQLTIKNTLIRQNNADISGYVLYANPSGIATLEGNVVTANGNETQMGNFEAFSLSNDSVLTATYNTIFQNKSDGTLFRLSGANTSLNLYGNIIMESNNIYNGNGSLSDINCNLFNDLSTIEPSTSNSIVGTVDFINSTANNYRLAETDTVAIDVCDSSIYLPGQDLQGNTRGVDLATVMNHLGPYDLGAYEYDDYDLIFKNSFE